VIESLGKRILAFNHDGSISWIAADDSFNFAYDSDIALADIDLDGVPEIILAHVVLNHDGTIRWIGQDPPFYKFTSVANLDLDDTLEVISGNTVYAANGGIYWQNTSIPNAGFHAVGNFDADNYPEIVHVAAGYVYLLEHTGEIVWCVGIPGGGHGGPPTIADVDGDGEPEIGVAGASYYIVFETNGTVKWQSSVRDHSSNMTGSSMFDFEGDGSVEVIYADEYYLRIYRGKDGGILSQIPIGSATLMELPIIVDVDHDNNAEIIVPSNNYIHGPKTGIQVFGDANDSWVNTRKIWNQHSYHITNVNDDGTIPQFEANSWEVHNTYRCT
jgi:hypothetical protein